jgi:hypothetical protein
LDDGALGEGALGVRAVSIAQHSLLPRLICTSPRPFGPPPESVLPQIGGGILLRLGLPKHDGSSCNISADFQLSQPQASRGEKKQVPPLRRRFRYGSGRNDKMAEFVYPNQ